MSPSWNLTAELSGVPVIVAAPAVLVCVRVQVVDEGPGPGPLRHDERLRLAAQEDEEALQHLVALSLQVEQPQLVLGRSLRVPPESNL